MAKLVLPCALEAEGRGCCDRGRAAGTEDPGQPLRLLGACSRLLTRTVGRTDCRWLRVWAGVCVGDGRQADKADGRPPWGARSAGKGAQPDAGSRVGCKLAPRRDGLAARAACFTLPTLTPSNLTTIPSRPSISLAMSSHSESELKALKVADLKELCTARSLPTTGRKDELIARLLETDVRRDLARLARDAFETPNARD
jgi:hypothetical protein